MKELLLIIFPFHFFLSMVVGLCDSGKCLVNYFKLIIAIIVIIIIIIIIFALFPQFSDFIINFAIN